MQNIIVAIDGYSSCGKSTLAKALAKHLHYIYVDTGAMYRAVTLFFLQNNINHTDKLQVDASLKQIKIHFQIIKGQNTTFLNGVNIEEEIRTMEVSNFVSPVSTVPEVRRAMVKQQQLMGAQKGIVMDGRDIGTVVFKEAELKIFLTADIETRVNRRWLEMKAKGHEIDKNAIKQNLEERDFIDSNREDSPLRMADDAILLDNTNMSPEEMLQIAIDLVEQKHALFSEI